MENILVTQSDMLNMVTKAKQLSKRLKDINQRFQQSVNTLDAELKAVSSINKIMIGRKNEINDASYALHNHSEFLAKAYHDFNFTDKKLDANTKKLSNNNLMGLGGVVSFFGNSDNISKIQKEILNNIKLAGVLLTWFDSKEYKQRLSDEEKKESIKRFILESYKGSYFNSGMISDYIKSRSTGLDLVGWVFGNMADTAIDTVKSFITGEDYNEKLVNKQIVSILNNLSNVDNNIIPKEIINNYSEGYKIFNKSFQKEMEQLEDSMEFIPNSAEILNKIKSDIFTDYSKNIEYLDLIEKQFSESEINSDIVGSVVAKLKKEYTRTYEEKVIECLKDISVDTIVDVGINKLFEVSGIFKVSDFAASLVGLDDYSQNLQNLYVNSQLGSLSEAYQNKYSEIMLKLTAGEECTDLDFSEFEKLFELNKSVKLNDLNNIINLEKGNNNQAFVDEYNKLQNMNLY